MTYDEAVQMGYCTLSQMMTGQERQISRLFQANNESELQCRKLRLELQKLRGIIARLEGRQSRKIKRGRCAIC